MGSMRRYVLALSAAAGLACLTACSSKQVQPPEVGKPAGPEVPSIVQQEPGPKPMWVDAEGPWEEQWNKDHPNEAKQWLWVVGTSQGVEDLKFRQAAERNASDQAIFELVRALGVTRDSLGVDTDISDNATRDLVMGTYAKSLGTTMAHHDVNLKVYEWYQEVVKEPMAGPGGVPITSYIMMGLFRLNKGDLNGLAGETAKEFAKGLQERVQINADEQKKLSDRAQELVEKRVQDLMGK